MTILHVPYNCHPDTTGGAIRTRYLVETQARLGLRPVVLSSPFQPPADPAAASGVERFNGIPYYRCYRGADPARFMQASKPLWERAAKLGSLPAFVRRIREVAQIERAEVIHAHSLFFCGLAAAAAGRALGLPVVYEIRSLIEEGIENAGWTLPRAYRLLDGLACRLASHVVVISEGLRGECIRRGVPAEKITVCGNGVASLASSASLASLGWPPDAVVLGYIGTLLHYEGLDLLLEAAALLAREDPRVRLLIVGDGNARAALEQQASRLGLDGITRFLGRVAHEELAGCYSVVDLFVCPRRPGRLTDLVTPLKPLEIMAHGKPLLAGDCGGHRELIEDGVNGALFRDFAPAALARRIAAMLADPAALAQLGRRARDWAGAHRRWESQCRPVIDVYEKLAALRHRRSVWLVAPLPGAVVTGGVENGVGMILRSKLASRHRIRVWRRGRLGPARQIADFVRFGSALALARPDVVHVKSSAGMNFAQSAVYAAIGRALGRRVLLQLHSGEFENWYRARSGAAQWAIRRALRVPSRILVLSERWRSLIARLAPGRPVTIVPNGVEIQAAPPRRTNGDTLLRVATIATLGAHKGHFDILAAAANLRDQPVRFLLAGPDETFGRGDGVEIRRRAAELALDGRVRFLGPLGADAKWDLLAGADVFLLPSRAEGLPNAVLEAMAARLPVIATPVGSLPEVFAGGPGVRWIAPGDAGDLAAAVLELLADPARRARMGCVNRWRIASGYSFARVEQILDRLYRDLPEAG